MTSKTKILTEDCQDFLIGKCNKLFCDRIHNYSKLYKKENNLLFNKNFSYLKTDFSLLLPYQHKLFSHQQLDLMFIVDCTGSMLSWIVAVKKELKNIIQYILDNNPYADIKVSFVGYRDIKDAERFDIFDFSSDTDACVTFIDQVNATGGGDLPEDMAGGLSKGLNMSWREKSAKYCILIADAPCHGNKYHNFEDDFPKGNPNGLVPENIISDFAKKDITFYVVKIRDYTSKMYEIFNDAYIAGHKLHSPIVFADLGKSTDDLGFIVSISSNTTLNNMTVNHLPLNDIMVDIEKEKEQNNSLSQPLTEFLTRIKNSQSTLKHLVETEKNTKST